MAEQLWLEMVETFGASAAPRRSLVQGARRGSRKAGAHLAVSSTGRRPRTRSVQVRLSEAKLVASTSERRSVLSGTDAAPRHLLNELVARRLWRLAEQSSHGARGHTRRSLTPSLTTLWRGEPDRSHVLI